MPLTSYSTSDNSEIETPVSVVLQCLELVDIEPDDKVLDCCAGRVNMVWYDNIPSNNKDWCEILLGKDFLDYHEPSDWIIGNLPFNKFKQFFEHLLTLQINKGFGIISLSHHLTPNRLQTLKKHGYYLQYVRRLKISEWRFGFLCDFMLFTKKPNNFMAVIKS